MSAFVVDAAHIDALLSAAINGPSDRRPGSRLDWQSPYVHERSVCSSHSAPATPMRPGPR